MAKYLNEKFADAHGNPVQQMPHERLMATSNEAARKLKAILIDLKRQAGLNNFKLGPNKTEERIEQKARQDFKGDTSQVLDYVRGKEIARTPMSVLKAKAALTSHDSKLLEKYGAELVQVDDFFEDPKNETGYRCINIKIAIPVNKNKEKHIVEVQIVAEQIEDIYEKTHKYIEKMRDVIENARDRKLTPAEKKAVDDLKAACQYYNGVTSRDCGYDELLRAEVSSKHAMTPQRKGNLYQRVVEADRILNTGEIDQDYKSKDARTFFIYGIHTGGRKQEFLRASLRLANDHDLTRKQLKDLRNGKIEASSLSRENFIQQAIATYDFDHDDWVETDKHTGKTIQENYYFYDNSNEFFEIMGKEIELRSQQLYIVEPS